MMKVLVVTVAPKVLRIPVSCKTFAMSATLASLVTNTTLSLSVEACSIFVIDTLGCLDTMLRQ